MSTMPLSTANWHWKNKTVTPWAKSWFERELVTVEVTGKEGEKVSVERVVEVDGDVELGRRKSKLITIYDCRVVLKWTGSTVDGTTASGRLVIPEVSHEITLDGLSDYVYEWSLASEHDSSNASVSSIYALAKSSLPALLETKFKEFPVVLVDVHGKDILVSEDPSRTSSPAPATSAGPAITPTASTASTTTSTSSASALAPVEKKPVKKVEKKVNGSLVEVDATFQAAADDLFGLLTDEKRIPMWSRAPAQSAAKPDTEYALFGGGVKGKYISLTPGKEIKQTWALQSPTWPSEHEATMTVTFEQSTDSTKVTFSLDGVPTGMEDEIKRNIEGYYVLGFKNIGYVQLILSDPSSSSPSVSRYRRKPAPAPSARASTASSAYWAMGFATLVLVAAFAVPFLSTRM